MSNIDKQRVAAVRKLDRMGYAFAAGNWMQPANDTVPPVITDALHALLVQRADALMGCRKGSDEECELEAIAYAVEANQAVRWPLGHLHGGKG